MKNVKKGYEKVPKFYSDLTSSRDEHDRFFSVNVNAYQARKQRLEASFFFLRISNPPVIRLSQSVSAWFKLVN